jgi:nucleotide-binding universal stress UspA family protein
MRAIVWIVADTWEATVDEARAFLPADAEVTLLHVAPGDVEDVAAGARHGLLGRRRPRPRSRPRRGPGPPGPPGPRESAALREISDEAAAALLADARERIGGDARTESRRGRVEREVVAAAEGADLLVLARDGDHERLGPHSLGPPARFVVDHAPCRVLLVWPDAPPEVDSIPPPPPHHR